MQKYSTIFSGKTINILASDIIEAEYIFTFCLGNNYSGLSKIVYAPQCQVNKVAPYSHFLKTIETFSLEELFSQIQYMLNPDLSYLIWEQIRRTTALSIIEKTEQKYKKKFSDVLFSHNDFLIHAKDMNQIIIEKYTKQNLKSLIEIYWNEVNIFKKYCILEIIRNNILSNMDLPKTTLNSKLSHEEIYSILLYKYFVVE